MRQSTGEKVFRVINAIALIVMCIFVLYPYLNQLAYSLNEGADSMKGGITLIPRKFTLDNYIAVIKNSGFSQAAFVSVIRVVFSTLLSLFVVYSCAYGLTRKGLPHRKGITLFLMIPAYISAGIIPTYILYRYLHLMDNILVYILPGAFVFYNMVIIRSFLQDMPAAIEESAKIDGANDIVIMFKIILPLSMPVVATVILWTAVGAWNDWTTTLYFISDKDLHTLQYFMMRLIKESDVLRKMAQDAAMTKGGTTALVAKPTSDSIKSATLIITTLPIIMIYPFLQKYFIKGVSLGAVKE